MGMETKKYLTEQIKKCNRKMNLARIVDYGILSAAAGGILGMFCELASLVRQFYYVHLAAGLCFGVGMLAGIGCALYRRVDMKQAASRLDSYGLQERMLTAYEQMDMDGDLACMQREDAVSAYERVRAQVRISLLPDKRHIYALVLSAVLVIGLGCIPSAVREQARTRHQVQQQAKEEQEKLAALIDALDKVDRESLTEEQKMQLQALADSMQLSREELENAATWESLNSAMEKLDFKYGQAGQSLENLAGQLADPGKAGLVTAEELAKAAAKGNGQQGSGQMASSGQESQGGESGNGADGSSASKNPDGNGSGTGDRASDGDGSGSGEGASGGNGSGSGDGASGGNGSGSGEGASGGNGSGSGEGASGGNGSGNGNGTAGAGENGSGNGNGSNGGGGRGTGTSSSSHDYVSIPNAVANDSSLTGNQTGNQESDYYRQQNGLAWEGNHVDYNSVIGEYSDSAYEGIANGRYPSGMESVIRDYFESLNQ